MNTLEKIQQINSQRGNLILKAFGNHLIPLSFDIAQEYILKSERMNHKYIRKEGDKYIYQEENKNNSKIIWNNIVEYLQRKVFNKDKIINENDLDKIINKTAKFLSNKNPFTNPNGENINKI